MAASFGALEARVNAACMAALANVDATLPDESVVQGIFDNGAITGGVWEVAPAFTRRFMAGSTALADLEIGDVLTINETDYSVTAIEPDGTGMTTLGLK